MVRETQKILVIDDSPVNLEILSELVSDDCEVLCALSGEDGIGLALRVHPDLILLDVMMPVMDGYEVCARLKSDPLTRGIPVIFITALNQEEDETRGLELGAIDYVTKPINLPIVRARIRNHLELKRTESVLQERTELLLRQQQQLEALNRELEQRVATEVKKSREKDQALMQREKMASIGQLAAGVAHEINNPMGFISANLGILADYFDRVVRFDRIQREIGIAAPPELRQVILNHRRSLDLDHLLEDGVNLIYESLGGAKRVKKIIEDLKSFSHVDQAEKAPVALSSCLESALNICSSQLSGVATIRKEYSPVPELLCHPGQLNQLFLNLLVNAGQAMVRPGEIVLRCWHEAPFVCVSVSDSGRGIPEELRERIFEPFFTTRDVGRGTGLGLSVSAEIIKNHQGELLVESVVGRGSTFTVRIPVAPCR